MDSDTIIYIVILVISLIVGAIGKNKSKQKMQSEPNNANPNRPNPGQFSFENLIKEAQNSDNYYDREIEIGKGNSNIDLKNTADYSEQYNLINDVLDSPVSNIDTPGKVEGIRTTEDLIKEVKPDDEIEQTNILENFNLRSAIIYSEILNRKYN